MSDKVTDETLGEMEERSETIGNVIRISDRREQAGGRSATNSEKPAIG